MTTATLNRLRDWYPQGRFEVPRFRPNIVLESTEEELGMVEQTWIGLTLAIGDDVRLRIPGPCGRCVMTTLAQGDLPKAGFCAPRPNALKATWACMPRSCKAAPFAMAIA